MNARGADLLRRTMAAALIVVALGGIGCAALSRMSGTSPELRAQLGSSRAPYDPGLARFTFDDFGTLNTRFASAVMRSNGVGSVDGGASMNQSCHSRPRA